MDSFFPVCGELMSPHGDRIIDITSSHSPSHSAMCYSSANGNTNGKESASCFNSDRYYHIPPDPTDPNLGKRMLQHLLMGDKQLADNEGSMCKAGFFPKRQLELGLPDQHQPTYYGIKEAGRPHGKHPGFPQTHHLQQQVMQDYCNPAFIEQQGVNMSETLSADIMQLDDQMLQASLDVTVLPEQWENIQLTDDDYVW